MDILEFLIRMAIPVNLININTKKTKSSYKIIKKETDDSENSEKSEQQTSEQTDNSFSEINNSSVVKGSVTVNAKYVGHSAVTMSAEEAMKATMEQNSPPVNTFYVETAKSNEQQPKTDKEMMIQILVESLAERMQYTQQNNEQFTIFDQKLAIANAEVKTLQYFFKKYCPGYIKKLEEWKQAKDKWISDYYEEQRQYGMDNPDKVTDDYRMMYDIEIEEEQLNMLEKAGLAVDGFFTGIVKELGAGINGIVDIVLAPLDMAENLTSPGAGSAVWEGMTKDIKEDWNKGTTQGKAQSVGRVTSIFIPSTGALKGTRLGKVGKTGKIITKQTSGVVGKGVEFSKAVKAPKIKSIVMIEAFKKSCQSKIDAIRAKMPNNALKLKGNMAIAEVDIPGLKKEFTAHSKINNLGDKGAEVGDFSMMKSAEDRIFQSYEPAASKIDGVKFDRFHDTEAKILEDIASQMKDPNISGTVNLYTELPACQSCTNVIFEFRQKFPNIELNVFSGK